MSLPRISFLESGHCTHPERMALRGGSSRAIRFPATVAVIEHPRRGVVLFDTGYSTHFETATRQLPNKLYAWITPVTLDPEQTAVRQLARAGIRAADVAHVVVSHFHADHIAGLRDLPHSRFEYDGRAWDAVRTRRGPRALFAGFLPELVPSDFEARGRPIGRYDATSSLPSPFTRGFDLFGDGTLVAVPLPGHNEGHMGLLVRTADADWLLAGDAAWSIRAIREQIPPSAIAMRLLLNQNPREYLATLAQLGEAATRNPKLRVVPCHCGVTQPELPVFDGSHPPIEARRA